MHKSCRPENLASMRLGEIILDHPNSLQTSSAKLILAKAPLEAPPESILRFRLAQVVTPSFYFHLSISPSICLSHLVPLSQYSCLWARSPGAHSWPYYHQFPPSSSAILCNCKSSASFSAPNSISFRLISSSRNCKYACFPGISSTKTLRLTTSVASIITSTICPISFLSSAISFSHVVFVFCHLEARVAFFLLIWVINSAFFKFCFGWEEESVVGNGVDESVEFQRCWKS